MEEIIRWAQRFIEETGLEHHLIHVAEHAFKEWLMPRVSDIWDTICDSWSDIWSSILSFFG